MRSATWAIKKISILLVALALLAPAIAGCGRPPVAEKPIQEGIPEGYRQALDAFIAADSANEAGPGLPQADAAPSKAAQPAETGPVPSDPSPAVPPPNPEEQPRDIPTAEIVSASSGFDFALFAQIAAKDPAQNVVLSPLSVRMALAMAYNGADGDAKEAMAEVLDFEGLNLEEVNTMMHGLLSSLVQQGKDVQVEIANSFWGQKEESFYDDIVEACRDYYGAELQRVDFTDPGVVQVINGWAKEKTHGKIPKIVPSHEAIENNRAAWMNAVYLKAAWAFQFMKANTKEEDFILTDGQRVKVPLMRQSEEFEYLENEDFQAVCLPYKEGSLGMYVFLPREGKNIHDFQAELNRESWESWMQAFERREGTIYLPRFDAAYGDNLAGILKAMGMKPAFEGDALPNVYASVDPVVIMSVMHRAVIEVNEEGTEGAAVTYVGVGTTWVPDAPSDPFTMRVDRPFFFAIRDNQTGALLFMGSIVDPS